MDTPDATPPARGSLAARIAKSGTFTSLALPQFRLLLAGTAASQAASWMEQVARSWLTWELTHSAFQLGLLEFIRGVTSLIVSPFAGVLTERLDRRQLAAITQVSPGVVALAIGLLVSTGNIAIWQLYLAAGFSGLANSINFPARQVLVYDVVGSEYLNNAIALNSVMANVSRIAAPTISGIIIGTVGIQQSYYAQAGFFLLATLATLALRPITLAKPVRIPVWQGLVDGARYIRADSTIRRLVLLNTVPTLLIYPYVALIPIVASDVLNVGSTGYGVLISAVGIGSIPGGLIVASMTNSKYKGRLMGISALVYMGLVAVFAASMWFALSFVVLIGAGIGWSMMVTLNQTLLQLHLADEFRGRVLAFYTMANGLTPFGSLALGSTADRFGVQQAIAAFALTGFVLAGYLGLGSARVRRL
ncbi:MAG: MFS transporter [Dehalococcoidia bacterium]